FNVVATAAGAAEITRGTPGQLTLRTESIIASGVAANPPFTQPGGTVAISAQVQAVVNEPTQVMASYTVADSTGKRLFTSTPVPVSLSVASLLTTARLGMLDTTGFSDGTDALTITLTGAAGAPITVPTVTGSLVIGSPVTGTLTTTPAALPPGTATVTN